MTAKPKHMRSTGSRQPYFVSVDRFKARRLQDATTILRLERENKYIKERNEDLEIEKTALKNELKRMIG